MKITTRFIVVALVAVAVCISVNAQNTTAKPNLDSLYNVAKTLKGEEKLKVLYNIADLTYKSGDSVFNEKVFKECIALAQKQKNFKTECDVRLMQFESYKGENEQKIIDGYEDFMTLAEKHKFWKEYFNMFSNYVSALLKFEKYQAAIAECEKQYKVAQNIKSEAGLGYVTDMFGTIYFQMKRYDEAEKYLKKAIVHFRKANDLKLELFSARYLWKAVVTQKKYDEALAICQKMEKVNAEIDAESGKEDLVYKLYIDLNYVDTYSNMKQFDKAEKYLNKIKGYVYKMRSPSIWSFTGTLYDFYRLTAQYDKALPLTDSLVLYGEVSGNKFLWLKAVYERACTFAHLNKGESAADWFQKYKNGRDSVEIVKAAAQLDELRTKYEVDILEIRDKNKNRMIWILAVVIVLIIAFALIYIMKNRKILNKSRQLLAEFLERERLEKELSPENKPVAVIETTNQKIFKGLNEIMFANRYFVKNKINRLEIANKLNTNENYLHKAIRECVDMSFKEYIYSLRLDYAKTLLTDPNNTDTIEGIAYECGFQSRSTLYKLFVSTYGISPTEYRKQIVESVSV
ncbi:MAG: AraC family transcriptional regulator [Bacteroidales bacterium]|jgi:AraC-like DNA-binding protein|nr:AraC family transcriptional regulator [Bacteroidales bacterium]